MDLYLPRRSPDIPVMIFRSDFRELIRGEPVRGRPCRIAYAPSRLVPAEGLSPAAAASDFRERFVRFTCAPSSYPVTAHLQFRPGGPVLEVPLGTDSGPLVEGIVSPDSSATMLHGEFTIPQDAEWLMIWFTHEACDGRVLYDSHYGANYLFRFIEQDVRVVEASVQSSRSDVQDEFHCLVATSPTVDSVTVRYRIVNTQPEKPAVSLTLTRLDTPDEKGHLFWDSGKVPVSRGAVVAFDVIYTVGGRQFKEDNQGAFFIVAPVSAVAAARKSK